MLKLTLLSAFLGLFLLSSSSLLAAEADTLLITLNKLTYGGKGKNVEAEQKYKVKLDASFLAEFKNPPVPKMSSGTSFYCFLQAGSTSSSHWFSPWNSKITTWHWSQGAEQVLGHPVFAGNPGVTNTTRFSNWRDVDTRELVGYTYTDEVSMAVGGVNVEFAVRVVPGTDASLAGALLAPVRKPDGSFLVKGDSQKGQTLTANCGFQE